MQDIKKPELSIDNITYDDRDDESEISIVHESDTIIDTENVINPTITISMDNPFGISDNDSIEVNNKKITHINGYLKIVTGCMFSGKTSYIIREYKKWQSIGKNVLMINYDLDKRYTSKDQVVSHDKFKIDCVMINDLDIDVSEYDVILINEAQFFPQLKDHVNYWCDSLKKTVIISGLDGDYLRGKFGEILDLIPHCDEFIKLKAYCALCKDGTDALFTWKTHNNTDKKNIIEIGVSNYIPLCRNHYNVEKNKLQLKDMN